MLTATTLRTAFKTVTCAMTSTGLATATIGLLASVTFAPATAAQDFDAGVQQDPRAGLAIYDFHFQGPPRGQAALVIGTQLTLPLPLPPFGQLWTLPVLISPPQPLDANGDGQLRFDLPLPEQPMPITCQALFIDPGNNIRVTQRALTLVNAEVKRYGFGYLFKQDHQAGRMDFFFRGNPQGGSVRITIRRGNRIIGTQSMPIGANGTANGALNVRIQPGDTWSVVYSDPTVPAGVGRGGRF